MHPGKLTPHNYIDHKKKNILLKNMVLKITSAEMVSSNGVIVGEGVGNLLNNY